MHVRVDDYLRPEDVAANMRRLAALGMEVRISQMDVRVYRGMRPAAAHLEDAYNNTPRAPHKGAPPQKGKASLWGPPLSTR